MDNKRLSIQDLPNLSHPPAPIRLKFIAASLLNFGTSIVSEKKLEIAIRKATLLGDAILAVCFNRYPDHFWLEIGKDNDSENFIQKVLAEIPKWHASNFRE